MSLNESIKSAIQQHLPSAVAGELKVYIDQSQKYESENIALKQEAKELKEKVIVAGNMDIKRSQLEATEKALNDTKFKLEAGQRALDKVILETKLAAANEKCDAIFELVKSVFKNPEIVKRESTPIATSYKSANGHTSTAVGNYTTESISGIKND